MSTTIILYKQFFTMFRLVKGIADLSSTRIVKTLGAKAIKGDVDDIVNAYAAWIAVRHFSLTRIYPSSVQV